MSINPLPATRYKNDRMPQQSKKNSKKGEVEVAYDQLTVRDCLVWDQSKMGKSGREAEMPEDEPNSYFIVKKGELGQSINRGYDMSDHAYVPHADESGNAALALRGWPGTRRQAEDMENLHKNCPPPKASAKKNKKGKDKAKKGEEEEEVGDPFIGDLMSHRYLNDFAKQRAIEMEKDRRRKEAKEKAAQIPAWKKKTDIKGNKTSQLRSIALAEKVDTDAKHLWQMPKFKDNAKPHLTTFRKGPKAAENENEKRGYVSSNGEVVPACTCGDESRDLEDHDGRAFYDGEMEERYDEHPAMDDARDAQF